jgi:hypothetical protein
VRAFRVFAWLYFGVAIAAILFFVGVQVANPPREHMVPIFVLVFIGVPTSLAANLILDIAGRFLPDDVVFSAWFQVPLFCAAPLIQAWALFWLSRKRVKK